MRGYYQRVIGCCLGARERFIVPAIGKETRKWMLTNQAEDDHASSMHQAQGARIWGAVKGFPLRLFVAGSREKACHYRLTIRTPHAMGTFILHSRDRFRQDECMLTVCVCESQPRRKARTEFAGHECAGKRTGQM